MSSISDNEILYDNPCAPIVKFSDSIDSDNDSEDMTDDQMSSNINHDNLLHTSLEHSFKAISLEDLVKSFDDTIHTCFTIDEIGESIPSIESNLINQSNTWSNLIENLRTSLRNDLKLPDISQNCQLSLNNVNEKHLIEDEFISIDDLNEDEEEELREQLDMHSINFSSNHEPFLIAEKAMSDIDFILQDITPDSGYDDDLDMSCNRNKEYFLKAQSINFLNLLYDELNLSIKNLSSILIKELAIRDELEYEKETKNIFISFVLNIQNKHHNDHGQKHHYLLGNNNYIASERYITTAIPYNPGHPNYLSVEYLENLNKILHAINEDSAQVTELFTNYVLKTFCPY